MKCCEFHRLDCDQGDLCPIRIAGLPKPPAPTPQDNTDDDTALLLLQGIALLVGIVSAMVYATVYFT